MRIALTLATALSLTFPALVFALDDATASAAATAQVTVTIDRLYDTTGTVEIGLYANEAGWNSDGPVASLNVAPVDGTIHAVFENLDPGNYAVRLYHDVDGDGEFGTNVMGIPNEPYGFSNNPWPRFRGARFDESVFELDAGENSVVAIELMGG